MMLTAKQVAQELFDQQVALAEELTDQGVLDKALLVETLTMMNTKMSTSI